MWLLRRYAEVICVAVGAGLLAWGLHMPPPIGQTKRVVGPIENLVIGPPGTAIDFVVSGERVTTNVYEPGYDQIRRAASKGTDAEILAWPGGGWPGDAAVVVEISIDGHNLVSSSRRLALHWAKTVVFLLMSAGMLVFAGHSFLQTQPLSERYYNAVRLRRRQQQDENPVSDPVPGRTERVRGVVAVGSGIAAIAGSIALVASGRLGVPLDRVVALIPLAGLYLVIIGSHRAIFGRAITLDDSPARRILFGAGIGCLTLMVVAAALLVGLAPP